MFLQRQTILSCCLSQTDASWRSRASRRDVRFRASPETRRQKAPTLPKTYRRWVSDVAAETFEASAELRTLDLSPPAPDEVLVRTAVATINAGHATFVSRREGFWKDTVGTQHLGADGLGEVVAVGDDVKSFKVGDYVTCVFCASFSEYVTPKAVNCYKVPTLNPDYAAIRMAGTYACCVVEQVLGIESDTTVLITAACGGVGHILVQIAKLNGAHVIGTCGGPVKKEKVMGLGADRVIDYKSESVAEVLQKEYPKGLDYAIDGVGGEMLSTVFDHLAPGGKVAVIGLFSEYPHNEGKIQKSLDFPGASSVKDRFWKLEDTIIDGKHIICNTWPKDPALIASSRSRSVQLYEEGKLRPLIDEYAFQKFDGIETAVDAINYMLKGTNVGKVLMKI